MQENNFYTKKKNIFIKLQLPMLSACTMLYVWYVQQLL